MSIQPISTLGQFVASKPIIEADYLDVTMLAKEAGFHFSFIGISQAVHFQVVDVPERIGAYPIEMITKQLLKRAWREARKFPSQSQVSFTVCKPAAKDDIYAHHPVTLVASIEHNVKSRPVLIITTLEEAQ